MLSALVISGSGPHAPALVDDLMAAGIDVIEGGNSPNFGQEVLSHAADVVIFYQDRIDTECLQKAETVGALCPKPVIVFTRDPDAETIGRAMQAGIHAYVIDGYSPGRLRPIIHLAQARFRRDRLLQAELIHANKRFEERKLLDRAKGILMGSQQLREEEAYRVLRRVAMDTNQRIGQVSQRVIDASQFAEAVNRAGQLRMLSQRIVKLFALHCAQIGGTQTASLLAASTALVDDTLARLKRDLSAPTFGDLIEAVSAPWTALKGLVDRPRSLSLLEQVDRAAEEVLARSEQLTDNLEISRFANALHVINVAGRQRMLSQRLAKAALLGALLAGAPAARAIRSVGHAKAELVEGIGYLMTLPLSNSEITGELAAAARIWDQLQAAVGDCHTVDGQNRTADLSEKLLLHFDRLTTLIERAMQAYVGFSEYRMGQPP